MADLALAVAIANQGLATAAQNPVVSCSHRAPRPGWFCNRMHAMRPPLTHGVLARSANSRSPAQPPQALRERRWSLDPGRPPGTPLELLSATSPLPHRAARRWPRRGPPTPAPPRLYRFVTGAFFVAPGEPVHSHPAAFPSAVENTLRPQSKNSPRAFSSPGQSPRPFRAVAIGLWSNVSSRPGSPSEGTILSTVLPAHDRELSAALTALVAMAWRSSARNCKP